MVSLHIREQFKQLDLDKFNERETHIKFLILVIQGKGSCSIPRSKYDPNFCRRECALYTDCMLDISKGAGAAQVFPQCEHKAKELLSALVGDDPATVMSNLL